MIEATGRAGVRHPVNNFPALGVSPHAPVSLLRHHAEAERRVVDSGAPSTILKPNAFLQNRLDHVGTIKALGVLALPQGDGKVSHVDTREIATAMLTEDGHAGRTYDITGPEALSNARIAETMSATLGRPVTHQDVPGMPDWLAQGLTEPQQFFGDGNAAPALPVRGWRRTPRRSGGPGGGRSAVGNER